MHRKKINKLLLSVMVVLSFSCLLFIFHGFNMRHKDMKIQEYVFSHRGASGEELEHTFKAYDLAIEYGSKYIEQDLVTSKDGTLYVSHDLSAKKLTGVDRLFSDMSDLEIDDLRTEEETSILTFQEVINRYGKK